MVRFNLNAEHPPKLTPAEEARLDAFSEADREAAARADVDNPPFTPSELERVRSARPLRRRTGPQASLG